MTRQPSGAPSGQLALNLSEPAAPQNVLDTRFEKLIPLSKRLPPLVRFGTSSWSFPGWAGLVFPSRQSEASLARDGLRHYVRHPLFRTVGIDNDGLGFGTPHLRFGPACVRFSVASWISVLCQSARTSLHTHPPGLRQNRTR